MPLTLNIIHFLLIALHVLLLLETRISLEEEILARDK